MDGRIYLTDLKETAEVTISCKIGDKTLELTGNIVEKNEDYICLDIPQLEGKRISFQGISTNLFGTAESGLYYKFQECTLIFFKGVYAAKCTRAGIKVNRRGNFRLGISVVASMIQGVSHPVNVYVRDVSVTGFSISTEKNLAIGEAITVRFADLGCRISLTGKVVRMEPIEGENRKIYGLQLVKKSAALESYITLKQRNILQKKRR